MYAARHACRRAAGALRRAEGASFVDNALMSLGQTIGTRVAGTRAFAASADAPLLVTMIGAQKPVSEVHRMIEASGAEIKESRNVRLGGRASNMFLVTNVDPMALKKQFEGQVFDFFSVFPAKNTVQDIKGPYCETSPLLPYVRKATMSVPFKKGVVNEITEFLCSKGVTLSHMDEYRSGKDIVLECIMHLPPVSPSSRRSTTSTFSKISRRSVAPSLSLDASRADRKRKRRRKTNASSHRSRRDDFVNLDAAIHM